MTSEIGQVLLYDRRDNRIEPTDGYFASIGNDFAGAGFGVRYLRNKANVGYYYSVAPQWVLSFTAEAGYIFGWGGDPVFLQDRFFVGGDNLRGFEPAGIGPRDSVSGDALGGNKYYLGTVALGVPLGLPKELGLSGRVFSDFGTLFSNDQKKIPLTAGAACRERRRSADHPGFAGVARQRRRRGYLEIAGRADPPRSGLSDQERIVRQDADLSCQFRYEVLMSLMRAGIAPLVSLVLVCGAFGYAEAQQTPPSPPPAASPALSVLVVDVQSLLQNSKSAKMVRTQIEQKRSEYAKEISQQEESLRRERDSLAASAGVAIG